MKKNKIDVKYLCCIYATAPFIKNENLRKGFEIVSSEKANRAFTVAPFPAPISKALKINEHGHIEMMYPEYSLTRSQDLPEAYYNAGQFHWYNVDYFVQSTKISAGGVAPIIIQRYLAVDIDTPEDWETAEIIHQGLKTNNLL
ncbi:MAG: hypothetical protein ACOCUL_02845 [Bacteroidota bacterium]